MRTITFEVPAEAMADFAEKLMELELTNSIVGKNDDGEFEIEVEYDRSESDDVDELEEYLDELKAVEYPEGNDD